MQLRVLTKWLVLIALADACSGTRVVSVLAERPSASIEHMPPLLTTIDASNAHLPLNVSGASVAYGDVDRALADSVERATRSLAEELAQKHARPLELTLEIVDAHAEYERERLLVRLGLRATLRERAGNTYLAQTHVHASAAATVTPERGAKIVLEATDTLGGKLSGWLAGMDLR